MTTAKALPSFKTLDTRFEIKTLTGEGVFEGYASVFGIEDEVQDVVAPHAFASTLERHKRDKRMPALLWQHDRAEPIGVWEEMREDDQGLYVRGRLFVEDIPRARQAHALLKGGGLSGLSIGFHTVQAEIDAHSGIRTLTEIELLEVSLVTFPALQPARVSQVKSDGGQPGVRKLERALREAGLSRTRAKAILAHGYAQKSSTNTNFRSDSDVDSFERLTARMIRAADVIEGELHD